MNSLLLLAVIETATTNPAPNLAPQGLQSGQYAQVASKYDPTLPRQEKPKRFHKRIGEITHSYANKRNIMFEDDANGDRLSFGLYGSKMAVGELKAHATSRAQFDHRCERQMLKENFTRLFLDGFGDLISMKDVEYLAERLNDEDNTELMIATEDVLKARFAFLIMHTNIVDYDADYTCWEGTSHKSKIFVSKFKINQAHTHKIYTKPHQGAAWLQKASAGLNSTLPKQAGAKITSTRGARCASALTNFDENDGDPWFAGEMLYEGFFPIEKKDLVGVFWVGFNEIPEWDVTSKCFQPCKFRKFAAGYLQQMSCWHGKPYALTNDDMAAIAMAFSEKARFNKIKVTPKKPLADKLVFFNTHKLESDGKSLKIRTRRMTHLHLLNVSTEGE